MLRRVGTIPCNVVVQEVELVIPVQEEGPPEALVRLAVQLPSGDLYPLGEQALRVDNALSEEMGATLVDAILARVQEVFGSLPAGDTSGGGFPALEDRAGAIRLED
jgi:hypothetical protein